MRFPQRLILLLLPLLLITLFISHSQPAAVRAASRLTGQRMLIDSSDPAAIAQVQALGGLKLADYDSFSLWLIPADQKGQSQEQVQTALTAAPARMQVVDDTIYLRGMALNTSGVGDDQTLASVPNSAPQAGFWMVQFIGPIKDEWLDVLRAAGLSITAYLPDNAYVVWGSHPAETLAALKVQHPEIRWDGPYLAQYRQSPDLRSQLQSTQINPSASSAFLDVTVQVFDHPQAQDTVQQLLQMAAKVYLAPVSAAGFIDLSLQIPSDQLSVISGWSDVFNVETWSPPVKMDESQGQILAGNLSLDGSGNVIPSGPGYLNWLQAKGFPSDPNQYPIVDVVDDGVDAGSAAAPLHPDFYYMGLKPGLSRIPYLNNCTSDSLPNSVMGHGNINAGIVGAYNNALNFPYQDTLGYRYGLGISPFGRVAGTKIFRNDNYFDISKCADDYSGIVAGSLASGAEITSNSWGSSSRGSYTVESQIYDALTRDASASLSGNQPMLHVFAAGNYGSYGSYSVTPPGTAKNVLTVGATEGVRANGVPDGCGHIDANNADDIAGFSSIGPTSDGRTKPDLMAPGTHISGPASQDPGFNGIEVCGNDQKRYYPYNQTLYTWSSGTSHSTPAVAGAAQLAYEYYQRVLNPGQKPSPAMLKALLINSARYLTGIHANDVLPSEHQGWGDVDLGSLFDGMPRFVLDQSFVFHSTGNQLILQGNVQDTSKPLRVTLVWTDAPGATTGNAYVNNLDLEVTVGGQVYQGNHFNGANSISGGSFDSINNVENVFLPAEQVGNFQVRVIARNLAGDGVPGDSDLTDQDFALVIENGVIGDTPSLSAGTNYWSVQSGSAPILGSIQPGDTLSLSIQILNKSTITASGVSGKLTVTGGNAAVLKAVSAYPDIQPGSSEYNLTPYQVQVNPAQSCGQAVTLNQTLSFNNNNSVVLPVSLPVGLYRTQTVAYNGAGVPIPDNQPGGASVTARLNAPFSSILDTLRVTARVSLQHSNDSDLTLALTAPDGKSIWLSSQNGGSGQNYTSTVFDDSAKNIITAGSAPFTGIFRPEEPLSTFLHSNAAGDWTLKTVDQAANNSGQVTEFSVTLSFVTCSPEYYQSLRRIVFPLIINLP